LNVVDFPFSKFDETVNGASAMVVMSFFLLSLSVAIVAFHFSEVTNVVAIPVLAMALVPIIHLPYNIMKYFGCLQFFQAEASFEAFHRRCSHYSEMPDVSVLMFGSALISVVLFGSFRHFPTKENQNEPTFVSGILLFATAALCHGVMFYNVIEGSLLSRGELLSHVTVLLSICIVHTGLLCACLDSRRGIVEVNKMKVT